MRIGIITFWESTDNYGQVLQAYALQNVLKAMGHEPFQIRYSLKASQQTEQKSSLLKKVLKVLLIYPLIKSIKRHYALREDVECKTMIERKNVARKFQEFRDTYIKQDQVIYNSIEEIRSNPPVADCYITGSDQVWTMLLSIESNAAYYLDFGCYEIKRISYAASFGRSVYPQYLHSCLRRLLNRFDAISVREQEGVDICESLGIKAQLVLDPTLLLSKKDYFRNFNICTATKDNTLYVYSINVRTPKEIYWKEVRNYAEKKGLKITVTTSSGNIPGREIYENVQYSYATVEDWILQISKAHLVVTTSFHGVVFCMLMHTNFIYIPLNNSRAKGNGRVESLANIVNLSSKICYNIEEFAMRAEIEIDWNAVDNAINKHRIASKKFLTNNL